jgi:signal transduction histidine kinase
MKLPAIFSKKLPAAEKMPLAQWMWRAYCKSLLLPLLCMQIVLVGVYFVSLDLAQRQQLAAGNELAAAEAKQRTQLQANSISQQLAAIAQAAAFLQSYSIELTGQKASPKQALDPVYRRVAQSNPRIAQFYYSTYDDDLSYSYPYRQVQSAATPAEAPVWTDIYQSKSTPGWLSSLQLPVYSAGRLQGIVGVDVRLDRLLDQVMDLNTAGYAMLIAEDGKMVVMPARGRGYWTEIAASKPALAAATIKLSPAALAAEDNASILLAQINAADSGVRSADLGGMHLVSWALIAQTDWKLVLAAPAAKLPALKHRSDQQHSFGWYLACVLLGLYVLCSIVLYRQARKMSQSLSAPLVRINQLVSTITAGHELPPLTSAQTAITETGIKEFSQIAQGAVLMGLLLDVASKSRQLAEAELEQRNRQLQSVFDLSPDGLMLTDAHSQVVLVNPALCQLIGVNAAEYLFKSDQLLWQKLVQLSTTPELVLPGQLSSFRLELEMPHKSVLQCQILNMNQQDSTTAVKLIQLRDITRDAAVDQMKSEFITTAAHELRTPLTSVLGYSELLMKDMIPADMRTEALGIVVSKTKLVIDIINEMLDLARIEARHGMDFNIQPYLADVLVQDVLASYPLPPLRSPIISSTVANLTVNVDQEKFKAVLTNVLDNAYKYSSSGDVQLQIIADSISENLHEPRRVGFRVVDAGIGMNPQQIQHAFDRFWRADASGNIPGTGLGLAIVKEVMGILGGSVDIASAAGAGTTVTLWLPAAAHHGEL